MIVPALFEDALDLLVEFHRSGVRFLVIGAHAVAAHGAPRATQDFDVWVQATAENAVAVFTALTRFGAPLAAHGVTTADFAVPDIVYQIGLPPRRIDVSTSVSGLAFEDAWADRLEVEWPGVGIVPVMGRATLITNKRATGRLKDLADVEALERSPG